MATYLGGTQLDQAQEALDQHPVSSADGLCVKCRVVGPCSTHEAAAEVFALSARLPRRQPGAPRPGQAGATGTDFNWLTTKAGLT